MIQKDRIVYDSMGIHKNMSSIYYEGKQYYSQDKLGYFELVKDNYNIKIKLVKCINNTSEIIYLDKFNSTNNNFHYSHYFEKREFEKKREIYNECKKKLVNENDLEEIKKLQCVYMKTYHNLNDKNLICENINYDNLNETEKKK